MNEVAINDTDTTEDQEDELREILNLAKKHGVKEHTLDELNHTSLVTVQFCAVRWSASGFENNL